MTCLLPYMTIMTHGVINKNVMSIHTTSNEHIEKLVASAGKNIKTEATKELANAKKEERQEVYDGLTIEELGNKIERNLNSSLTGYGQIFANYSIELGVDPYLALAIVLHETGCKYNCSYLTNACHNIGGQKGTGCGEYAYFGSMEEGIYAFLNNLHKNYYLYGLTTTAQIGKKYAEDPEWPSKVNRHIYNIQNS